MAQVVFRHTYRDILSPEQMEYMMDMMYSMPNLCLQLEEGHHYYIAYEGETPRGYVSVQYEGPDPDGVQVFHLHKIYVMPDAQGKGVGLKLFQTVKEHARAGSSGESARISGCMAQKRLLQPARIAKVLLLFRASVTEQNAVMAITEKAQIAPSYSLLPFYYIPVFFFCQGFRDFFTDQDTKYALMSESAYSPSLPVISTSNLEQRSAPKRQNTLCPTVRPSKRRIFFFWYAGR